MKVTPSSKVAGDMALMMVAQDLSREGVLDHAREMCFPASMVEMLRGDLGQPAGGWPHDIQARGLVDEAPITVRPTSLLGEVDLAAARESAEAEAGRAISEPEFASFASAQSRFVPVVGGPNSVYFYGMEVGREINVTIERCKTLVLTLIANGGIEEDGTIRMFFELNGQPRVTTVADRKAVSTGRARVMAEEGNVSHTAAPMPGLVAMVGVSPGQHVERADRLVTLEAMKIETSITALFAETVRSCAVKAGDLFEAKQLIVARTRS